MGLLSVSVQNSVHCPLTLCVVVTLSRIPTSALFKWNPAELKLVSLWLKEDSVVRIPNTSGETLFFIREQTLSHPASDFLYLGKSSRFSTRERVSCPSGNNLLSIRERALAHIWPYTKPCLSFLFLSDNSRMRRIMIAAPIKNFLSSNGFLMFSFQKQQS